MATKVKLQCDRCGQHFERLRTRVEDPRVKHREHNFCSKECYELFRQGSVELRCTQCLKAFTRKQFAITANRKSRNTKSDNVFCSKSCAATYNNLHKTTGTRRSKLEVWLEEQLRTRYPDLEILFNAKEAINAELDIHFPSLNLAFELNGIYHYEPIHGAAKLASIQTNDGRKFQACLERGIELCVIDTAGFKKFKENRATKYLDIVTNIVDEKID